MSWLPRLVGISVWRPPLAPTEIANCRNTSFSMNGRISAKFSFS
jgi:hypothetical protein